MGNRSSRSFATNAQSWRAELKPRPKQRPRTQPATGGRIDAKQRRALARLGLATVSAYAAPTLLALRSSPCDAESPGRVEFAA